MANFFFRLGKSEDVVLYEVQKDWISSGFFRLYRLTPNQIMRDRTREDKPWEPSWQNLGTGEKPPPKPDMQTLYRILNDLIAIGEVAMDTMQYADEPYNQTFVSIERLQAAWDGYQPPSDPRQG